jgi:hypothetical protein
MQQADEEVGGTEEHGVVFEGARHPKATTSIAPLEASIVSRTPPSTSIVLVNRAYTATPTKVPPGPASR